MTNPEAALARPEIDWRSEWSLDPDVTYLNHGSFGPSPVVVQEKCREWTERLERQPMDFLIRQMEPALENSLARLSNFVGTSRNSLVFVDNATMAMNIVAASVRLDSDDEVLLTNHEYGAVQRLWKRRCLQNGARVTLAELPCPLGDPAEVVDAIFAVATSRTKLIVVSHVTSPTAVILPVEAICRRARELGIPVCIDGPHAINMVPVELRKLDCDFYVASLHKWLCAPFGSGFLFVHPRQQKKMQPAVVSWGGSIGGRQPGWKDEFVWLGTRNPAAFLAVPEAIDFFEIERVDERGNSARPGVIFREHAARLLKIARSAIEALTGLAPLWDDAVRDDSVRDDSERWCGTMISLPLPSVDPVPAPGKRDPLQDALYDRFRIEIPVVYWQGHRLLRVSAHLYNSEADIGHLVDSLQKLLPASSPTGKATGRKDDTSS
jgi:isopenicillin-N epimerase